MINFCNILMYLRYYKKTVCLRFLKKIKGLDYTGRIENTDKSLRGYEGCYPITAILKKLNITKKDTIIDIGCGKGLFLYYASKFDFNRIDGIEYSSGLTKCAKQNAKIIADRRMHIYHCDARVFSDYYKYNYFFLNNPFNAEIMEEIVIKLKESSLRKQIKITVIYQFPFNQSIFEKHGFKILYKKFPNLVLTFE